MLGNKFVPDLYINKDEFLNFYISNLDVNLLKLNSNYIFSIKRLEGSRVEMPIPDNPMLEKDLETFTLESVLGDSFFDELKSKINKNCNTYKKEEFYSKLDINLKVAEFRSLLQIEIIKESVNFSNEINFSGYQVRALKGFLKHKPFKILDCDKNIGNALIDNDNYLRLAFEFLDKDPSYTELDSNPLEQTILKINFLLDRLFIENEISLDIRNILKLENTRVKLGNFKLLAKLHKTEFGWRPILNSIGHPTSKICFMIDKIFQPYVIKTDSHLKDSQNLIQICETTKFDRTPNLYSLDFSSLYSNINPTLAIPTLAEFFKTRISAKNFSLKALVVFLKIIFDHNIFKFEGKYFVQNKGLAMGCICGPSFANLYLHILEKSWCSLNKPRIYLRFIDDIFMALDSSLDLEQFKGNFHNLNLTMNTGKEVVFLDTIVTYNILNNKLVFDLYIKPTNNGNYLLPYSLHPSHIIENIPRNLMTRIKRICSFYVDFIFHVTNLCILLFKRGYDFKKILINFSLVCIMDRDELIPYKKNINTNQFFTKNSILFPRLYTESLRDLDKIIYDAFNKTINVNRNFKLNLINKLDFNLGAILVNKISRFSNSSPKKITKPCNNCIVCSKLLGKSKINILDLKFNLELLDDGDCNSIQLIYIIICDLCNLFYIGETNNSLKSRIKQHLNQINKFIPFIKYHDKVVAKHFNLKGHNISHFKCCIFKRNLKDSLVRKSKEQDLIRFLNMKNINCLNLDITKSTKSFTFL